jgi:hypothetical protein
LGVKELHRYEFTCDGRVYWGNQGPCLNEAVTEGYNPVDAEPPSWDFTTQGWLCEDVHYNDPRYQ